MAAPRWLHSLHRQMERRLGLTLTCLLLLAAGVLGVGLRVELEQDVAALLPGGPDSPREAARLLGEFGALDTLLIDLSVPGASADRLVEVGETLVPALLSSGYFREVYAGPTGAELVALGRALLPRKLLLLDSPAETLRRRLEPDALASSLTKLRTELTSPQALGLKRELLADPLGLGSELLSGLAAAGGALEYHKGFLLSSDRKHLLLVTTPKASALSVDASQAMLDAVSGLAQMLPPGAKLVAVGGPRFAAESAAGVKRDVLMTFVSSALALLVIFVARFRSVRMLLLGSLPLGVGVASGLAVCALTLGRIHGLSLGFGAALVGIAIDFPVHLLNRAASEGGDSSERLSKAVDAVWGSLWLGVATTGLAFCALFFSRFPGLRELSLFGAAGVAAAFLVTLFFLPPLCARLGPKAARRIGWSPSLERLALPRKWAIVVVLAALFACAFLARGLRFDGELRNLDAQRPETLREHEEVLARFGQGEGGTLAVVRAPDLQAALEANDDVYTALQHARSSGWVRGLHSVSGFVPSVRTQRQRGASLEALLTDGPAARLSEGARAAGFSEGAFAGFWQEVRDAVEGRIEPLRPESLAGTSLASLMDRAIRCGAGGCLAVSTFELTRPEHLQDVARRLPASAKLIDGGALAADTVAQIPRQLLLLCGLGLLSNLVLLAWVYRSLPRAFYAVAPCLLGLLGTVAILAAVGIPLNLVSASALVLVLGCGVDYGIFVQHGAGEEGEARGSESLGVLLASLTTLAGFGTLAFANHRALQSLGLAIALGIFLSAVAALFLLPGLLPRRAEA